MGSFEIQSFELSLKMGYLRVVILVTLVLESLASSYNVPDLSRKEEAGKRRKSSDLSRITGGEPVDDIKQYGFMASIQAIRYIDDSEETLLCAGFILKEDVLATAAYCVFLVDEDDMDVRVGSTQISDGTPVPIEDVIISPNYNHDHPERGGNLALVIPDDDLPMSSDVFAINYVRNLYTLPEEGSMITVLGWGQTEPGDQSSISDELRKVEIPKITSDQCAVSYFFSVADNEFCAGTILGGGGPCQGDMGGPALYDGKLIGVVSGGRGCGAPVSPSIFTDITHRDSVRFITLNANFPFDK